MELKLLLKMTRSELVALAKKAGYIYGTESASKDELISMIMGAQS